MNLDQLMMLGVVALVGILAVVTRSKYFERMEQESRKNKEVRSQ